MSTWMMMYFQDANSPTMEILMFFHEFNMMFMIIIILMIFMNILFLIYNNNYFMKFMNNQILEIIWTFIPMFILMNMAIPSILNLYYCEEINNPIIIIKIIGHQWYWSFEYSILNSPQIFCFLKKNFNPMYFFMLETDYRMLIPFNMEIQFLVTSMDVIHSFSIPSMGMKIDGCPGRINKINMISFRPGIYFGQCSEICGINHSFMPIIIETTKLKLFLLM